MTRNEWIAETAREYNIQGTMDSQGNRAGFDDFDTSLWQAERDASILEKQGYAPWIAEPESPASDEIVNLREEVAHWRVKAEAYGGMVHGCSPVFERIGFPIESHKPDGRVGGIARAAEAIGAEMARLRAAPALTDTAAKVVEAAEFAFNNDDEDEEAACKARVRLWDAVRAHLAAKQGGAK